MKIFDKPPKLDNDFFMFVFFLLGLLGVIIVLIMTWNDFKVNLNPYVLVFFYGLALGYWGGKVRRGK